MTTRALNDVRILFGAVDLSPFSGKIDTTQSTETKPTNNFAAGGNRVTTPCTSSFDHMIEGWADFASGGISQAFSPASKGQQGVFTVAPVNLGNTVGDPCLLTRGLLKAYRFFDGGVGDPAAVKLGIESDTAEVPGFVGAPLASRTTTGFTGAAVTMAGPTATQRLYADLHVSAAAGTNLVVKVQSAPLSNFAAPTDRITFSTMSATGWQWATPVAGAITDGFWRIIATIASGSFTFFGAFGVL